MGPALMAAIQAAPSVAQLFIGENSLFSGKKRLASRKLKEGFEASQAAGINKGYYDVLASQMARANQGMGMASKQLAQQQQARGVNRALSALSGRRSALSGISQITSGANDLGLQMAAQDEALRRENRAVAEQTQMNIAGLEDANAQRKRDELKDYWGTQRQESDASISSAIQGIGQAIGTGIQAGQFNKQMDILSKTGGGGGSRAWGNVLGPKESFFSSLAKKGADTFVQSAASSLGQNIGNAFMPQRPNTSRLLGNQGNWAPGLGTSKNIIPKYYGG